jgi:hypothetical protein
MLYVRHLLLPEAQSSSLNWSKTKQINAAHIKVDAVAVVYCTVPYFCNALE